MGRPIKENAEYFTHQANASSDNKVVYLESKYGHMGYAFFFKMLEELTVSNNFKIEINEITKSILAKKFSIPLDQFENILTDSLRPEIKCFVVEDGFLFSPGLFKRMSPLVDKREYNRKKAKEEKGNSVDLPLEEQQEETEIDEQNDDNEVSETETEITVTETIVSDDRNAPVKESKVKNSKVNINNEKIFLEGGPGGNKDDPDLHPMQKFIKEKCPNIRKLQKQLTFEEATKLMDQYGCTHKKTLIKIIENMENYKPLSKKSVSVYLTILNWMRRELETNFNSRGSQHNFAKGAINPNQIAELREIAGAELGDSPRFYQEE